MDIPSSGTAGNQPSNRITLLQKMVDLLYKRSLVDKVFASSRNGAKLALQTRDLAESVILSKLDHVEGNIQGKKNYKEKGQSFKQ